MLEIKLTIQDMEVTLSLSEAKELYKELKGICGKEGTTQPLDYVSPIPRDSYTIGSVIDYSKNPFEPPII